jgi:hypothetical protein
MHSCSEGIGYSDPSGCGWRRAVEIELSAWLGVLWETDKRRMGCILEEAEAARGGLDIRGWKQDVRSTV